MCLMIALEKWQQIKIEKWQQIKIEDVVHNWEMKNIL